MIILNRISKKTGTIRKEIFEDVLVLEEKLKDISSSHYNISDYSITSTNFVALVKHFKKTYNENYFTVDEMLETISINKLEVGEKRKRNFNSNKKLLNTRLERAVHRLSKIYDIEYDGENKIITFTDNGNEISFEMDEDKTDVKKVFFEGNDIETLNEVTKFSKKIQNYFKRLNRRAK